MGLQDSLCLSSSTIPGSNSPAELLFDLHQGEGSAGGDRCVNRQRGSRTGPSISGVLQPHFRCAEGFRCVEASNRPLSSQQVRQTDKIQDGIQSIRSMSCSTVRLDDFVRFKGRLSSGPYPSGQSKISTSHGGQHRLSIPRPLFWPFHCSTSIHNGHGSRVGHAAQSWDSHTALSRRLVNSRSVPSGEGRDSSSMFTIRNCREFGKVMSVSIPDSNLSRDGLSEPIFEGFSNGETCRRSLETNRRISILQEAKLRYLEMSTRPPIISVSSCSCGSFENAIIATSTSSALGLCGRGRPSSLEFSDSIRPAVVVRRSSSSVRGLASDSSTQPFLLVRCLGPGLRGPCVRPICFRPLVSRGEESFHQCSGTSGNHTGPSQISTSHRGSHGWDFCGQHYGLGVCQETGGTISEPLNSEAQVLLRWSESLNVTLLPQFVMGSHNVISDSLSRKNQVIGSEWTLVQEVVDELLQRWPATIDLFATSLNYRIPVYFSPINDPMAAGTDAFLQPWGDLSAYAFPPFALVREVIRKLQLSCNTYLTLIAPWWPQKEWFPDLQGLALEPPVALPLRRDLPCQPHFHRFHLQLPVLQLHGWRLWSDLHERLESPDR